MTPYVKKFIETNVDLLNKKDYEEFFYRWYDAARGVSPETDHDRMAELMDILETVEITESMTEEARKDVIREETVIAIEKQRMYGARTVNAVEILKNQYSKLYLTVSVRYGIIQEECTKMGLKKTSGGAFLFI